jgi:hypothetical protein
MPQALYETSMDFSRTVISIAGWFRLARLAALMPAASAPMTTNFMTYSFCSFMVAELELTDLCERR